MSLSRTRWNELLGISNEIREPDLYQLLGFERLASTGSEGGARPSSAFDPGLLEERFRERMQKVQGVRSTKHKEFIEFVKGELRRARRILADPRERADYDRELVATRAASLRRVLAPLLALGWLEPVAENALFDEAHALGLTPDEAIATIDDELARTGVARSAAAQRRLTDVTGLAPDAAAAVAAAEAAELARLAAEAASRALEAAHKAELARARGAQVSITSPGSLASEARVRAADPGPDAFPAHDSHARDAVASPDGHAPSVPERPADTVPARPVADAAIIRRVVERRFQSSAQRRAIGDDRPTPAPAPSPADAPERARRLRDARTEPVVAVPDLTRERDESETPDAVTTADARPADARPAEATPAPEPSAPSPTLEERPRRKKKKLRAGKKTRRRVEADEATAPEEEASEAPRRAVELADVRFCDECGVSLPARWKKTGEAERVGTRLLCAPCSAEVRAGRACAACSSPIDAGDGSVPAGGTKRLCASCASSSRRLKVCAGCQVILPRVALERGEARARAGKLYCKDCLAAATGS